MSFYQVPMRWKFVFLCLSLIIAVTSLTGFSQVRVQTVVGPVDVRAERPIPSTADSVREPLLEASREAAGIPAGPAVDPTFAPTLDIAHGFVYAAEQQADGKVLVAGGFKSVNGFATACIIRLNADRSIDTNFTARIRGSIYRVAVLPDGKVLIAGAFSAFNSTTSRFGIARLNSDGSLDTTFDTGSGPSDFIRDMRVQPDGKILLAGEFLSFDESSSVGIARLNANGSRDASFMSPLAPVFPMPIGTPPVSGTYSVGIQPDGKIVVAGSMKLPGDSDVTRRPILRLASNGSLDDTFAAPTMNSNPWEFDIQPDGKIVMVGFFTTVSSVSRARVARLNANGTLDDTFNPGTGANASSQFVRVLANGKVLIAGSFVSVNGTPRGGVALLNDNGSLDTTFAPTGSTTGTINTALPIAGDDYYVGGSFVRFSGNDDRNTLVAVNSDGSVDSGFSASSLSIASVRALGVQPDGKIIVGGFYNRLNGQATQALTRLNPNGSIDATFDTTGLLASSVYRVVFQPDGKLLVLGSGIRINNGSPVTIVRLNANGTHDPTFNFPTVQWATIGIAAAVQADGKIVFSYSTSTGAPGGFGLIRLGSDGSFDFTFTGSYATSRFESLAIMPNGQILAGGPFSFTYVNSQTGTSEPHNAVIRINADGVHDRSFRSALSAGPFLSAAYTMHLQQDGRILVGGRLSTGSPTVLGVVRLNSTGTIDGSFQPHAMSSVFGLSHVYSIHPTSDGKILAGGFFDTYGATPHANLVRLESNGVVDQTFTASTDYTVSVITTESNGSILIGGSFEKVNGVPRTAIARLLTAPARNAPFDFDGDGKTDLGIFRPGVAEWWINRSSNGTTFAAQFGATTDKLAPGDYTGDGKADIAIWRPSSGEWFILRSEDSSFFSFPFGTTDDVPMPADYDNDGKVDAAVFRESSATWYIRRSSDGGTTIEGFGANGDVPVVADYDGDGRSDIAIYRPSLGQWWIKRSTAGVIAFTFGNSTDKPVQGDYTGDGKADVAFWRPSTGEWYVLRSEDFSYYSQPFGTSTDIASPGDYDGDGKFDPTVFRGSSATWFSSRSTAGTLIQQFGSTGDLPVPNSFVP